jgi:hypothetical protein
MNIDAMNFDTTPAPATSSPPMGTAAPDRCVMDDLTEKRFDEALHRFKTAYGLTDTEIHAALYGNNKSGFGNMSKCKAVKTNRILSAVSIAVQSLLLLVVLWLLKDGGISPRLTWALHGLIILSAVLLLVSLRHPLQLMTKMIWYGSGVNTQALIILTCILTACMFAFTYASESQIATIVILSIVALVTIAKIVFSARLLKKPETTYMTATTSALNRVITAKKLRSLRKGLVM